MRVLLITTNYPYPADDGGRIRVANTLAALCGVADVDHFAILRPGRVPAAADIARSPARRTGFTSRPAARTGRASRLSWLIRSRLPTPLNRDYASARSDLLGFLCEKYDLVWFSELESFHAVAPSLAGIPHVVDYFDLEDRKLEAAGVIAGEAASNRTLVPRLRHAAALPARRKDIRAWRRLQHQTAQAATVTVCSDVDKALVAGTHVEVIPNGYQETATPRGRLVVHSPPVILMVGHFGYAPNIDGAAWLVSEVAPRVWSQTPEVIFRFAGKHSDDLVGSHDVRVTIAGYVKDIETEIDRADVSVVPIRFGSGTRIKILEAFCHNLPVVSTSAGAEGLLVKNDEHLLLADGAQAFADACVRLIVDADTRTRLQTNGASLFRDHYRWNAIHAVIQRVATQAANPAGQKP